ncbi:hypothetical protein [Fictibacillus sp. NRS-1165]|uniref:hypothetical protein n=1 Tax=Fictibacillus sp. NRS-1165 TaxID=3144463 RepID=UPI003D1C79B4
MVPIKIEGGIDPDGDPESIKIKSNEIDEPGKETDIGGIGTDTARVRETRNGNGDGREYHITFTAADDKGGVSTGKVLFMSHTIKENKNERSNRKGGL